MWTEHRILEEILDRVEDGRLELKLGKLDVSKWVAVSSYDHKVQTGTMDPLFDGVIPSLIHEALHSIFSNIISKNFSKVLEEELVSTLERVLYNKLRRSKKLTERFRRAVCAMLAEQRKGVRLIGLEDCT